jgi:hypothetical protein
VSFDLRLPKAARNSLGASHAPASEEHASLGGADAGEAQLRAELTGLLPPLAIPSTLHDSLLARLDCLAPKEIAQIGAALLRTRSKRVEKAGGRWFEAELHRRKGEVLLCLSEPNSAEAERCFRKAMAVAQAQGAKLWELRAATSLARLWAEQGQRATARNWLAPVYDWFTEGFDTADLKDARALLEELG